MSNENGLITFAAGVAGAVIGYFTPIGPYGGYLIGTAIGAVVEGSLRKDPEDQVFTQESFVDLKISSSALGESIPRMYGVNRVAGKYIWASQKIPVLHRERFPSETPGSKLKGGAGPDAVQEFKTYKQHFALGLCEGPVLKVTRMWLDETLIFDVAQPSRFTLYTADAYGNAADADTFPVLVKGADRLSTGESGLLFTGGEDQMPSQFIEEFEGSGEVPAFRGLAYLLLRNVDLGASGRVPNFTVEVVQATQSTGRPVALRATDAGAWTAWATEVTENVEGYGSGELIFYNASAVHPEIYGFTGGRGTNSLDIVEHYGLVSNGQDESLYVFDQGTGKRMLGPVQMNPESLPSTGVIRPDKTIIEHQTVFASERKVTRNEGSYIVDGMVYGSRVQLTGSQAGNNGTYTVENVIALEFTVFEELVGDEEAESFTITVLGRAGTVGLDGACLAYTPGGIIDGARFAAAAICASTSDFRLFEFADVENIVRLDLGTVPSKIVYDHALRETTTESHFYVACEEDGIVKKVGYTTGPTLTLLATITMNDNHAGEAILVSSESRCYVTEGASNAVWVFTTDADKVEITANIGLTPIALCEDSDGYIWVANSGERSVSRIDPVSDLATKFPLDIIPTALTEGTNGSVWVACESQSLVIHVDSTGATTETMKVSRFPIALDTDGQDNVWALCDMSQTVVRINPYGRVDLPEANNGLACVVRAECERVGLEPEEVDVSGLDVQPVSITIAQVTSARTILEQLAQAYQFTGIESGFSIRFAFKSDAFNAGVVDQSFLAATASAEPPPSTMALVRHDVLETPTRVIVVAESRARSYNADSQSHKINSHRDGVNNVIKINLPMVLDRFQMKTIAQNLLFELLSQRQSYRLNLPPRFMLLEPFDVVSIESTIDVEFFHVSRMTDVTLGNNLDIEVTAADYKRHVYQEFRSVPAESRPTTIIIPDETILDAEFIEPPYIIGAEEYAKTPRILILPHAVQGTFVPALAFVSYDTEDTYDFLLAAPLQGIAGNIGGIIPDGPTNVWDDVTEIVVTLDSTDETLQTCSDLDALNRHNAAMVGGEIIYFTTPTLSDPGVYTITRILRGRLGTEDQVAIHEAGERFYLLDHYTLDKLVATYLAAKLDVLAYYKVFPTTSLISNAISSTYTPAGRSIQPWAPLITSVSQNIDGDWTVTWLHRSRTEAGDWNSYYGISYDPDDTGMYTIRLYGGNVDDDEVSIEFTSGPWDTAEETRTWTYLIADQTADGHEFESLDVGICTMSTRREGIEARYNTSGIEIGEITDPGSGGVSVYGAGYRTITHFRRL